jgi:hypothetical protein
VPLHWLRSMSLADLQLYQRYTARRGFPGRRVELLLAQVALVLAQVNGNKDARLSHFLFDPPADDLPGSDEPPLSAEQAAQQVADFFGFAPRKRRTTTQDNRDTNDGQQPG